MGLGNLLLMGALLAPCDAPAGASDVTAIKDRQIEVPIGYDPLKKNDIKEMLLYVSRDGKKWEQFATATTAQESVSFKAAEDGVHHFHMVIVDKKGGREPADLTKAGPGMKVLIDTKPPTVLIRSAEKVGDDVTVSWEISEEHPDTTKFALEYKGVDGTWYPIEGIKPLMASSARFQLQSNDKLAVRVKMGDAAGNEGEMVKEVAGSAKAVAASTVSLTGGNAAGPSLSNPPTLPALGEGPTLKGEPPVIGLTPPTVPKPDVVAAPIPDAVHPTAPATQPLTASNTLASNTVATTNANGAPLPAAQVINVSRFEMGYEIEGKGASGIGRAEVWVTRDDGKTWIRWAVSDKVDGSITVDLEKTENRTNPTVEGMYGFKIVLASGAGLSKGAPVAGELPEIRVDVDVTPPALKLFEPIADPNQRHTMVLKWHASDRNLAADPICLEWAEQADGPWRSVVEQKPEQESLSSAIPIGSAKRLPNTGSHAWKLPADFPNHKVYLRVTARDTAGNIAEVKTKEPVLVDMSKPVARINGIIGASGERK